MLSRGLGIQAQRTTTCTSPCEVCVMMPLSRKNMTDAVSTEMDRQPVPHRSDLFYKTKMCKFNAAGSCTRGAECVFAHSTLELQRLPDLYKSQLCVRFEMNRFCKKGVACQYAHGVNELRNVQDKTENLGKKTVEDHQATDGASNGHSPVGYQAVVPYFVVPVVVQPTVAVQTQDMLNGQGTSSNPLDTVSGPQLMSSNGDYVTWDQKIQRPFAPSCRENFNERSLCWLQQGSHEGSCTIQDWSPQPYVMVEGLDRQFLDGGKPCGYLRPV